jgi:hypothetical protein
MLSERPAAPNGRLCGEQEIDAAVLALDGATQPNLVRLVPW